MKRLAPGEAPTRDWCAVVGFPAMHVGVKAPGDGLVEVAYLPRDVALRPARSPLAARVVAQLERYRDDPSHRFDLPLVLEGSAFQRRVWAALTDIPCGRTLTYGGLAQRLGSVARAIGQACGANPVPLVVPCHRVVAATGLGGFGHRRDGFNLEVKRWLLQHERALPA